MEAKPRSQSLGWFPPPPISSSDRNVDCFSAENLRPAAERTFSVFHFTYYSSSKESAVSFQAVHPPLSRAAAYLRATPESEFIPPVSSIIICIVTARSDTKESALSQCIRRRSYSLLVWSITWTAMSVTTGMNNVPFPCGSPPFLALPSHRHKLSRLFSRQVPNTISGAPL